MGESAHGDDRIAFGKIIGDRERFAIGLEAIGGALDQVVSGFAVARIKDFQRIRRKAFGDVFGGSGAVEEQGDRRADAVGVLGEHAN